MLSFILAFLAAWSFGGVADGGWAPALTISCLAGSAAVALHGALLRAAGLPALQVLTVFITGTCLTVAALTWHRIGAFTLAAFVPAGAAGQYAERPLIDELQTVVAALKELRLCGALCVSTEAALAAGGTAVPAARASLSPRVALPCSASHQSPVGSAFALQPCAAPTIGLATLRLSCRWPKAPSSAWPAFAFLQSGLPLPGNYSLHTPWL